MGPKIETKQQRYQKRLRAKLIADLGGKCVLCGSADDLTFDHPKGRDYEVSALNQATRILRYRKDWEAGNLRLLCFDCNRKNLPPKQNQSNQENEPF